MLDDLLLFAIILPQFPGVTASEKGRGTLFDLDVVDAFLKWVQTF